MPGIRLEDQDSGVAQSNGTAASSPSSLGPGTGTDTARENHTRAEVNNHAESRAEAGPAGTNNLGGSAQTNEIPTSSRFAGHGEEMNDTESLELAILLAQVKTSCDQIYSLSVHFLTILDKCPHVLTHHLMVPIHRHLRHLTEAEKVRASGPDSRIAYRNLLRADLADQRQYLFDWSRSLARWESEGRGQEVWVIMNRVAYWEERWNVNEWERSLIAWEERMGKMDLEEMADAHVEIREVMEQLCVFGGAVADQGWT